MGLKAPEGCNAFDLEPHLHGLGNRNQVGYTSDRWLNIYALMCGYQEYYKTGKKSFCLFSEGDCYHVITFDETTSGREWMCFDNIHAARTAFANAVKGKQYATGN